MKETISIRNFGGLKDVTIPLNSINIFIGKQASGKSVTAKLIYFYRKVFTDIFEGLNAGKKQGEIENEIIERFKRYFPSSSWSKENFVIEYKSGYLDFININNQNKSAFFSSILIERKSKTDIKISISQIIKEIRHFQKGLTTKAQEIAKDKGILAYIEALNPNFLIEQIYDLLSDNLKVFSFQMFIPAGRSFFSNIQTSIFSIFSAGNSIDPFLIEFGSYYERFKHLEPTNENESNKHTEKCLSKILNAKFISDKTGDYLIHNDGRKINLLFCSSGQQEVLPLALILKNQNSLLNSIKMSSITLYIEEPEAHLFPSAQKKLVEIIATAHNQAKGKSQLVITTHSPYILTSFNNLLEAGRLLEKGVDKKNLFKIVPEFEILKCGELNAYAFQDGDVVSLIDEETGLISADLLDQVSEEIAIQFDELLELQ